MRTVIVTTGTSLLTNRDENVSRPGRPWQSWAFGSELPDKSVPAAYLEHADPLIASAETHTLVRLPLRETDRLVWLCSDTPEGQWCGETLQTHYATRGYLGTLRRIDGLGYHNESFAERGLRNLLAETFKAIDEAGGADHAVLCATGGFKAQMAYMNLVGILLGVDVHYLHERFDDLITLPRLPLQWNTAWVGEREVFFRWIDDTPRRTVDVERRLKAQPELRALVSDSGDGHSYLTAAGDLLYRTYRARAAEGPRAIWPAASTLHPREKNHLSEVKHHRPDGWERWVDHLCRIDCVASVRYESAGIGTKGELPRIFSANVEKGWLGIAYGRGDQVLPMLVETTARGEEQLSLVRGWIERNMKKW